MSANFKDQLVLPGLTVLKVQQGLEDLMVPRASRDSKVGSVLRDLTAPKVLRVQLDHRDHKVQETSPRANTRLPHTQNPNNQYQATSIIQP